MYLFEDYHAVHAEVIFTTLSKAQEFIKEWQNFNIENHYEDYINDYSLMKVPVDIPFSKWIENFV